ncbi:hypothetical protein OH492_13830 [Vibrio chagasii]|nr:hypothetical protein [Vibrio chagasii]
MAGGVTGRVTIFRTTIENIRHDSHNEAIAQTGGTQVANPTSAETTNKTGKSLITSLASGTLLFVTMLIPTAISTVYKLR